jgi:hypothetical protein
METDYQDDYQTLVREFDIDRECIFPGLKGHGNFEIRNLDFESAASWVHEWGDGDPFPRPVSGWMGGPPLDGGISGGPEKPDGAIRENIRFRYPVFIPENGRESERFILLFHGLNERKWDKYLPWALSLSERCRRPVILFPIAFHMNRAPSMWGNPRKMKPVADRRKKAAAESGAVSFVNAAISHRLEMAPDRFMSSGLHTYYDVVKLLKDIKSGALPFISPQATPDIFAYSIGAFLGEVLMASNPHDYFDNSRLFMFCGGGTIDMSNPVSRTILDANAYHALSSWLESLFRSIGEAGRRIKGLVRQDRPEVRYFKSFLFCDRMKSVREEAIRRVGPRMKCLGLLKDMVFPPEAIEKTLSGPFRHTGADLVTLDFDYKYKHEEPFPLLKNARSAVNNRFNEIFSMASDFFCSVS